ncbi:YozQ family protein [Bacillus sp. SG-1]|uniref:YozQ family protein n=1 Tax=Bacillus sp. SG-1 TaxID=161544 RepID=UPI001E60CD31|nr:YozQ family protein [Bacillus sp. SG-1]
MKKQGAKSTELAGRTYEAADYNKKDELSQGLAMTHEQASDSLTEGTIDGKIDDMDKGLQR